MRNCIKWVEPGRLEGRSPKLGPVQIFTFSCARFLNFRNTGAELGQYFCAYTIEKQIEDSTGGLNPHNRPSGYIRGFFLVQTTWGPGDNYGKMHTSSWRMHW